MTKNNPRFELTKESKIAKDGITKLFRLKVKTNFYHKILGEIKAGTLGGWVESLKLKDGRDRVSGNAWVYGDAEVSGNAWVSGDAEVSGNAEVYGDARVSGDARVYGKLKIDFVLCSRFNFEFDWQINLWKKLEGEFEKALKNKKGD